MALCRDKVLVKRFFHHSPPACSILISIETRSDRAVPTMDWVSSLPSDIQRNILGRIPFEEVAGTSILSTTSNWSEHSVILDKLLFEERGQWIDELHPSAWVNKVEEILNNHREGLIPIQKFVLHIPDMQYKWGLFINIWLSYLSSNSIKELSVDNCNVITYMLSSISLSGLN
ncbi:F-box protein At1g80960-like [Camellia sinensis]|uniref:F-box protein At1g80960-like n=1 Tax=Camellia sinensis TaxID=4442 RepID=UPI0010355401|nr:F-box protein At1g80960-like [Camellia sinensis]